MENVMFAEQSFAHPGQIDVPKKYQKKASAAFRTTEEARAFAEEMTIATGIKHNFVIDNKSGSAIVFPDTKHKECGSFKCSLAVDYIVPDEFWNIENKAYKTKEMMVPLDKIERGLVSLEKFLCMDKTEKEAGCKLNAYILVPKSEENWREYSGSGLLKCMVVYVKDFFVDIEGVPIGSQDILYYPNNKETTISKMERVLPDYQKLRANSGNRVKEQMQAAQYPLLYVEHQVEFDSKKDCFGFDEIIEEEQCKTFGVEKQYCVKHSLWSKQDKKLYKPTTIGSVIAEFFSYLIIFTAVFTTCFLLVGTTVDDLPSAMTAAVFLSMLASYLTLTIRHCQRGWGK